MLLRKCSRKPSKNKKETPPFGGVLSSHHLDAVHEQLQVVRMSSEDIRHFLQIIHYLLLLDDKLLELAIFLKVGNPRYDPTGSPMTSLPKRPPRITDLEEYRKLQKLIVEQEEVVDYLKEVSYILRRHPDYLKLFMDGIKMMG
jgi:hypothetical protein